MQTTNLKAGMNFGWTFFRLMYPASHLPSLAVHIGSKWLKFADNKFPSSDFTSFFKQVSADSPNFCLIAFFVFHIKNLSNCCRHRNVRVNFMNFLKSNFWQVFANWPEWAVEARTPVALKQSRWSGKQKYADTKRPAVSLDLKMASNCLLWVFVLGFFYLGKTSINYYSSYVHST